MRSLVPRQVRALPDHGVVSLGAGSGHYLAVTEAGNVLSREASSRSNAVIESNLEPARAPVLYRSARQRKGTQSTTTN